MKKCVHVSAANDKVSVAHLSPSREILVQKKKEKPFTRVSCVTDWSHPLSNPRKGTENALKAALRINESLFMINCNSYERSCSEVCVGGVILLQFKHPVTFSLFVLLASALFVEDLNERQRGKCIFYECAPLVYLPLWGLCIQSKPALEEKSAFSSLVPRCQRQGKLWLCRSFWYAFQTGWWKKTSQPYRLICNGDFLLVLLLLCASKSKTVKGVKRVTSLFSCNDFRKLEVCSVLFLRQFDLVGVQARPLSLSLTHALLKPWARIRHSEVITCQKELI